MLAVMAVLGVSIFGCEDHQYGITIWNKTGERIDDVNVRYGKLDTGGGVIVTNGQKGYGYVTLSIPDTATAVWRSGDGELHEVEVEVGRWIERGRPFRGQLYFVINPDDTISFIPVRDENRSPLVRSLDAADSGHPFEPEEPV